MQRQQYFTWAAALIVMFMAAFAQAQTDPRQVVIDAVDRMTTRIDADREQLKADPELARELVREELVDLVDFKRITRMVMGDYFGPSSKEQKYRFLDVFKNSLINTYASGITLYEGQQITTLPMQEGDLRGDYARVRMEIQTNTGKTVPIFYTLFSRDDQWKVINVYVNGLDLADTFKSQFAQGMDQYGDMDKVIDNWSADSKIDTGLKDEAVADDA
ncbi:MAG: MlaC/ttg2D family ABC transporter substrate-binding protein [Alcanivorax sediminis]|uniref:ABC transporter substrate-binding protein n=1 Tax=Alcanivorax sediminis TaxID=2663008 RepID=A0A6N7M429_9GAMM|nr:ABC transporter substrate-binding protein [Alcanivorax sediminis]MQX54930.1 ABC transporter substrate-binding protein [Alcanivorax sediminis]